MSNPEPAEEPMAGSDGDDSAGVIRDDHSSSPQAGEARMLGGSPTQAAVGRGPASSGEVSQRDITTRPRDGEQRSAWPRSWHGPGSPSMVRDRC
jgi:hypothetical protein